MEFEFEGDIYTLSFGFGTLLKVQHEMASMLDSGAMEVIASMDEEELNELSLADLANLEDSDLVIDSLKIMPVIVQHCLRKVNGKKIDDDYIDDELSPNAGMAIFMEITEHIGEMNLPKADSPQ